MKMRINLRSGIIFPVVLIAAVLFIFINGHLTGAESKTPPAANRMQPDHAPTPFSAEEIRSGCPRDRKIVFQVEVYGKPLLYRTITFVTVNPEDAVLETVTTGMDGKKIGKKQMTIAKWKDLQAHASFPGAQTEIRPEDHSTPAGTFDCWQYTVTSAKGGKKNVQRYWFAKSLPGPPVYVEETVDGRIAYKMTMLKTGR